MTQEPFGDIPLFREIQKLMASGGGPVNFEIARQVALAVASQGAPDPPVDPSVTRSLAQHVRRGEVLISGYTRLPFDEPVRSDVFGTAAWIRSTLGGWRWILEHLARSFATEITKLGAQSAGGADPMGAALTQVGPLLMGMQVGTLIGQLAKESLGRYDLPVPREDDRHLFFVAPNIERIASEYGLERDAFHAWLALHDVGRHLVLSSVPWVHPYFKSLLAEVVDAIEIDVSDLERRFVELQSKGMEALQEGVGGGNLLPVVPTERHRRALERLRSFLALFEGYASHAVDAVAIEVLDDRARIEEGMARRRAARSEGESLLAAVLGISVDRALENAGSTFCSAVVQLEGIAALNRAWDAPDNVPSAEEIKDPFTWMERQADP